MAERIGNNVIRLSEPIAVTNWASVVGKKEGEGPLADEFDLCFPDDGIGQSTWEKAEAELIFLAVGKVLEKAKLKEKDIDLILAGDLLNQCTASTYGIRGMDVPFAGLFGACSTMAYSMALASVLADGGAFRRLIAGASSHFCSAEKQFRYPLEYGGQRAPTAQWTVTGAGAAILGREKGKVYIDKVHIGTVCDLGIKDMNNMGAAMAPVSVKLKP